MGKIRKMMKTFENAMGAAAFAEAGEFRTAREMVSRKKKVLLGLVALDRNALTYAANICSRIDADLEVLYVTTTGTDDPSGEVPGKLASELSSHSIQYDLIRTGGSLQKEILDHTTGRNDILFVVIGSSGESYPESGIEEKGGSAWKRLKCPLVVVSHNKLPATA